MHPHPIPNHLETEDQFVFGLTMRQCLLLFVGAGLSDALFLHVFGLFPHPPTTLALLVSLALAFLCFLGVAVLALVKRGGRGLEAWGLVLLVYLTHPRVSTWHFNAPDAFERYADHQQQGSRHEEKQENQAW